ncbi:MAG: hypothetical protein Tsb002_18560 [Wenzhouxiangellaceae bacterium]
MAQIKMIGGFIQQHDARVLHQQRGEGQTSRLAAGKGFNQTLAKFLKIHLTQRLQRQTAVAGTLHRPWAQVRMAAHQGHFHHAGTGGSRQMLLQHAQTTGNLATRVARHGLLFQ